MSPEDIEKRVREVNATMAIEGMPLDDKDKDNLRSILRGEATYQEILDDVIASAQQSLAQ
jgi:hypothetical protein